VANKISTVVAAIVEALEEIEGLTVVERGVVPFKEPNLPAAGIVVDGSPRELEAGSWESWPVVVLVGLLARKGDVNDQSAIMGLTTQVLVALKTLADSNAPGGLIDRPRFSTWSHAMKIGQPLALVGAVIEIRVTVEGPLVTEEEE